MNEAVKPTTSEVTYLVLHPNGRVDALAAELTAEPSYAEIKAVVGPHFPHADFEHVYVFWEGKQLDMFVDETGQLKGLALNERATKVYRNGWLTQHPNDDPDALATIVGPALLFTRRIWF